MAQVVAKNDNVHADLHPAAHHFGPVIGDEGDQLVQLWAAAGNVEHQVFESAQVGETQVEKAMLHVAEGQLSFLPGSGNLAASLVPIGVVTGVGRAVCPPLGPVIQWVRDHLSGQVVAGVLPATAPCVGPLTLFCTLRVSGDSDGHVGGLGQKSGEIVGSSVPDDGIDDHPRGDRSIPLAVYDAYHLAIMCPVSAPVHDSSPLALSNTSGLELSAPGARQSLNLPTVPWPLHSYEPICPTRPQAYNVR